MHEAAHAVEGQYGLSIYGDKNIENEFLGKRIKLAGRLTAEGVNVSALDFEEPEYSEELDHFLYKSVGYEKLNNLVIGLFNSAYASTSLREYFANGFEEYFLGDRAYLRKVSPQLYIKIEEIIMGDENGYF